MLALVSCTALYCIFGVCGYLVSVCVCLCASIIHCCVDTVNVGSLGGVYSYNCVKMK